MDQMVSNAKLKGRAESVNKYLLSVLPYQDRISEAMRYSLLAGGKRLRPVLLLEFAELVGVSEEDAMPFAAALEMIHTYSLIHDDLPCMDDDDLRRGRPTNHKVFGEAAALLAGDGLLTAAFETMMLSRTALPAERKLAAAGVIAYAAGSRGMVGGQSDDVLNVGGRELTIEELTDIELRKTGALFIAACKAGVALGTTDEALLSAAEKYGRSLGLAFQIKDDILDCTVSSEELGKTSDSDKKSEKNTYVSILGIEKSEEKILQLTQDAVAALNVFEHHEFLDSLACELSQRTF